MNIAILDADSLGAGLNLDRFSRWGTLTLYGNTLADQRLDHIRGQDILILNRTVIDREIFLANPQLKLIALTATGFNNIDLDAAREKSVAVCNVVGYSTTSVAQHTFALLFSLLEPVDRWNTHVLGGQWGRTTEPFAHMDWDWDEVSGKNWGIIGLGSIGERVAQIATALGAQVAYHSPSGTDRSMPWPQVGLDELLHTSDIISIHSPLNDKTRGLLGADQLAKMKSSALLLNLGRGGIVDEKALAEALDQGKLRGAALDVMFPEPPERNNPLLNLHHPERLRITPHVAWASVESRLRCMEEVDRNITAWQAGRRRNRVD